MIANDYGTICEVLKKIKSRIGVPINYNPMDKLKEMIRGKESGEQVDGLFKDIREYDMSRIDKDGKKTYRRKGMLRKHVPIIKNSTLDNNLVSSIVTG